MDINSPPSLQELDKRLKRIPYRGKKVAVTINGECIRDLYPIGARVWFEYHCEESDDSSDAELWYHSHQEVVILTINHGGERPVCSTAIQRGEVGMPLCYKVRFDDGYEWTAMEDELFINKAGFYRPDPPKQKRTPCLFPVSQKIWVVAQQSPISDEALARLEVLVPTKERGLQKRCDYEVLAFHTQHEWDTCCSETEMKKRIMAKFRNYDHAEKYAQELLLPPNVTYFKIVLRG